MNTEQFSPLSKVWVYQADRDLDEQEILATHDYLTSFCREWTAHNQQLIAGVEILYKRFIVLKVDETHTTASGCSIDKSVRAMKDLSAQLGIDFFNRMSVPYYENNEIKTVNFNKIEQALEQKTINCSTEFFDMNVRSLGQLRDAFLVPLREHWAYPKI